jgi:hypothetical protein
MAHLAWGARFSRSLWRRRALETPDRCSETDHHAVRPDRSKDLRTKTLFYTDLENLQFPDSLLDPSGNIASISAYLLIRIVNFVAEVRTLVARPDVCRFATL